MKKKHTVKLMSHDNYILHTSKAPTKYNKCKQEKRSESWNRMNKTWGNTLKFIGLAITFSDKMILCKYVLVHAMEKNEINNNKEFQN